MVQEWSFLVEIKDPVFSNLSVACIVLEALLVFKSVFVAAQVRFFEVCPELVKLRHLFIEVAFAQLSITRTPSQGLFVLAFDTAIVGVAVGGLAIRSACGVDTRTFWF